MKNYKRLMPPVSRGTYDNFRAFFAPSDFKLNRINLSDRCVDSINITINALALSDTRLCMWVKTGALRITCIYEEVGFEIHRQLIGSHSTFGASIFFPFFSGEQIKYIFKLCGKELGN